MDTGSSRYKKIFFSAVSLLLLVGYGYFVYAAAPLGGYAPGSTLDPDCAPLDTDCVVTLSTGTSGWALTGNTGTVDGTNFIGTTDAVDFVVKVNGNEMARFFNNTGTSANSVALGGAIVNATNY